MAKRKKPKRSLDELIDLARQHAEQGELADAEALYREALTLAPDHLAPLTLLGLLLVERGDSDGAIHLLERAREIAPQFSPVQLALGSAYAASGHDAQAVTAMETAIKLDTTSTVPLERLAKHHIVERRPREAIGVLRRILRRDPKNVHARFLLAGLTGSRPDDAPRPDADSASRPESDKRPDDASPADHASQPDDAALLDDGLRADSATRAGTDSRIDDSSRAGAETKATLEVRVELPPPALIADLFDTYAAKFDQHLDTLQYSVPKSLATLVGHAGMAPDGSARVLDLGCGTGLAGAELRPYARTLIGSDLSSRMIARARQRGIYDELHVEDLVATLGRAREIDLIVAADVFIYVGVLEATFAASAAALRPGGLLAFSVERSATEPVVLQPTLRYAHADAYIRDLADTHGFTVERAEAAVLRVEEGKDVTGTLYLLRH